MATNHGFAVRHTPAGKQTTIISALAA